MMITQNLKSFDYVNKKIMKQLVITKLGNNVFNKNNNNMRSIDDSEVIEERMQQQKSIE